MDKKTIFINKLNGMLGAYGRKSQPLAGIDIDPTSITLLQLAGSPTNIELTHLAIAPLSETTVVNDKIQDLESLGRTILKTKKQANMPANHIAIAAPSNLVATKLVSMNNRIGPHEQESYAWSEARKAFPGLVNNLYLDFIVQNTTAEDGTTQNKMLLVAARKQELQPRILAMQKGGCHTHVIDVDYYALERAYPLIAPQLPETHHHQYIALLNIDSAAMLLAVMHNKEMVYYHRQSYHDGVLTNLAKHYLGIEGNGSIENTQTPEFASQHKEQFCNQIKRLLQFFFTETQESTLDHLVLSGRCAVIPEIDALIQETTGVPTTIANPFATMKINEQTKVTETTNKQAPAYLMSCGLAMRGLSS